MVQGIVQRLTSVCWPRSPYGVVTFFSYWATLNYRESYGLCASNGIMFNHESPRRGERLSLAKSRVQLQRSNIGCKRNCSSALSMQNEIGDMHPVCRSNVANFAAWRRRRYEQPAEVDLLVGDGSKAKKMLNWEPKVRFHELVRTMVDADMDLLSRETPREHLGKLP
ncbi:MAG: GDP-mannose 4,6-dehydratase [Candidatus Udaeobacter sp.]|nr:MAG: GDP-mannose 4,6-dehydratase [Candidatus Udaeobacter sp.]